MTAYLRVDDRPIRLRCDLERADHALVLDASMLVEAPAILGELVAAVEEGSPVKKRENVEACTAAYLEARGRAVVPAWGCLKKPSGSPGRSRGGRRSRSGPAAGAAPALC